ncbi:MAG: ribbon-helix-helix domain-containing protein [Marinibacterium sp.]|nr:ribbon-helix-helix domain-containing protein [Marinibacterium sp.]
MSRPRKHSLTLRGHRTSVSLEDEFWAAFRAIAREDGRAINDLAAEIDAARGIDMGLASAIRLFVLRRLQAAVEASVRDAGSDAASGS